MGEQFKVWITINGYLIAFTVEGGYVGVEEAGKKLALAVGGEFSWIETIQKTS